MIGALRRAAKPNERALWRVLPASASAPPKAAKPGRRRETRTADGPARASDYLGNFSHKFGVQQLAHRVEQGLDLEGFE